MKKLYYANIDVWNHDAGSLYVGASSIEEANKLLNEYEFDSDVTYVGRLCELNTPMYLDPFERTYCVLGDTDGLFCCEGEDWMSIQFNREINELKTHEAAIETFLDREMPFLKAA